NGHRVRRTESSGLPPPRKGGDLRSAPRGRRSNGPAPSPRRPACASPVARGRCWSTGPVFPRAASRVGADRASTPPLWPRARSPRDRPPWRLYPQLGRSVRLRPAKIPFRGWSDSLRVRVVDIASTPLAPAAGGSSRGANRGAARAFLIGGSGRQAPAAHRDARRPVVTAVPTAPPRLAFPTGRTASVAPCRGAPARASAPEAPQLP